jgi:hypothetical protein
VASDPSTQGEGAPRRPERSRRALVLLIVIALVIGVGGTLLVLFATGSFSTEIRAEPIQTPGVNPFMPPAGTDQPNITPPPNGSGSVSGATAGLYGGTLNNSSCDAQAMVRFLLANSDKAVAWASVLGINPADIPNYVADLTPVILRTDTAVTNHGFANGQATTVNSVLQAGTAVLVDKFGTPRVRCMCGNPLTPPSTFSRPRYAGPIWNSFSQANIVIIQPVAQVINEFIIVNPITNEVIYRPRGTSGDRDRLQSGSTPTPPTSTTVDASPPPPPAEPAGDVPEAFLGTWQGTIQQDNPPIPPYTANVTINQGTQGQTIGSGSYTSSGGCAIHWTLVSASLSRLVVNEFVDSGNCFSDVQVTLTALGSGTIQYSFEGGNGRGVLRR